ncbi:MAG: hypothetical protein EZS28_044775 [Streblomastix strix]|uniref:Uncharacterized protein n=1 Tax=Streblomastix strix TaxID=222440 RepID=A0A5J4TN06_9EUKA|nr:MAG: hypothetical protein EZS28_044775 [Streblomastix strix]
MQILNRRRDAQSCEEALRALKYLIQRYQQKAIESGVIPHIILMIGTEEQGQIMIEDGINDKGETVMVDYKLAFRISFRSLCLITEIINCESVDQLGCLNV